MSEPAALVEHFFRHEYGRLIGLLTRSLGVRHLELIEDAVQLALWRALQSWSRQGVPKAPAAWLYRASRNLAIDALRREVRLKAIRADLVQTAAEAVPLTEPQDDTIDDESLRLLFLCCQPSIPIPSQIALALKLVGGFGVHEIANGLLTTIGNIEKRITRAKATLREVGEELATLTHQAMQERLDSVLLVLYLIFNEGFAASRGEAALRRDLCEEAIRLTRMLLHQPQFGQRPAVAALLALQLMHSARLDTRVDDDQCIVLLAEQNRSQWNWQLVREAMQWMLIAAKGDELSRYHIEAAIAWEHCRAPNLAATDWSKVAHLYRMLVAIAGSPMVRLNAIIANSFIDGIDAALTELRAMSAADRQQLRPWWDCTMANLLERRGEMRQACSHWRDAIALAGCTANRQLIEKRLRLAEQSSV